MSCRLTWEAKGLCTNCCFMVFSCYVLWQDMLILEMSRFLKKWLCVWNQTVWELLWCCYLCAIVLLGLMSAKTKSWSQKLHVYWGVGCLMSPQKIVTCLTVFSGCLSRWHLLSSDLWSLGNNSLWPCRWHWRRLCKCWLAKGQLC